jgi:hypothetical protein
VSECIGDHSVGTESAEWFPIVMCTVGVRADMALGDLEATLVPELLIP